MRINFGDYVVLILLALWLAAVAVWMYKRKRAGRCIGCSGDCDQCGGACCKKRQ